MLLAILVFPNAIFAFNPTKSYIVFAESHEKDSISNFSESLLKSEEFNKGSFISFDDLLFGKVPGLLITPKNGAPGQSNQLTLRGQSRISGLSNPLIVIDGVPLYSPLIFPDVGNTSINNISNIINVSDIESIRVLKDVAAAAIYGNDAYNGAILITTKQADFSDKTKVRFTSKSSFSSRSNSADIISANEFRSLIKEDYPSEIKYLGNANTDWQDVIHQTGVGTDQHLSIDGNIKNTLYRVSAGYTKRKGVVKTTEFQRKSFGISGRKLLLNNHLSLNLKLNASKLKNTFADSDAFYCALSADPTQALYDNAGDYNYELYDYNPLALLNQKLDANKLNTLSAQLGFNYTLPSLPKLKIYGQVSRDIKDADRNGFAIDPEFISYLWHEGYKSDMSYEQDMKFYKLGFEYLFESSNKKNLLLVNVIGEKLIFESDFNSQYTSKSRGSKMSVSEDYKRKSLILSVDYRYNKRLFLNYIYRQEKDYDDDFDLEWQRTQSLGIAYSFIKHQLFDNVQFVNDISLKMSYGKSGDVSEGSFWSNIVRTESFNYGIDFSLFSNRISGTVELYRRENEWKQKISAHPNSGYSHFYTPCEIENKGWELSLDMNIIKNNNFSWLLNFNLSKNKNEITKYPRGIRQISNGCKVHELNQPVNRFYLMKQIYDDNGNPIQDQYVDDYERFLMGRSTPKLFMGLSSKLVYKKLCLNFTLRANSGNYTYSEIDNKFSYPSYSNGFENVSRDYFNTNFTPNTNFTSNNGFRSDYYLRKSSFVHLENISLTYNVNHLFSKNIDADFFIVGQNLKTWTSYKGLNPDTQDGIDYNNYPRPKMLTLGVELNF